MLPITGSDLLFFLVVILFLVAFAGAAYLAIRYAKRATAVADAAAQARDEAKCPKCTGSLAFIREYPNKGAGCGIAMVGLLLTPVLIGIPIILWGLWMSGKESNRWHCRGCGTMFPT